MGGHCGRFGFHWNVLVEGSSWQDQETGLRGTEALPVQLGPEVLEDYPAGRGAVAEGQGG